MASNKNASPLPVTKMTVPADDSRDEQFHLDITVKNNQAYVTKRPKSDA